MTDIESIKLSIKNLVSNYDIDTQYQTFKDLYKEIEKTIKSQKDNQKRICSKLGLKVGDIILVDGTKDGYGMREVKEVLGSRIKCYQLKNKYRPSDRPSMSNYRRTGYITTHDLTKVSMIYENGQFVDITTLWTLD